MGHSASNDRLNEREKQGTCAVLMPFGTSGRYDGRFIRVNSTCSQQQDGESKAQWHSVPDSFHIKEN